MLKPGYKTTELLAVVLVSIGSLLAAISGDLSPRYAAIASAVSVAAYAIGRGIAKAGATLGTVPTAPVPPNQPPVTPPQ